MGEPVSSRRKVMRTKSSNSLKGSGSSGRLDGSNHDQASALTRSGSSRRLEGSNHELARHRDLSRQDSHERTKGAEDYEDALAKVAERFSAIEGRSSGKARRSSRKLQVEDEMEGETAERRPSRKLDSYEQALAKVASRFSAGSTRSSGKAKQSSRDKLPDNYEEALAKVAARFGGSRSSGRANSSRNLMADESSKANRAKSPKRRGSHKQRDANASSMGDLKPKRRSSDKQLDSDGRPRRRTSRKLLDDEQEIVEEVKRRLSESSNQSRQGQKSEKEAVSKRFEYARQASDDSMDFNCAIVQAMNEDEANDSNHLDEPKRKVERRGSDSSLDKKSNANGVNRGREPTRGLRRTTSEEVHAFEFAERAEADVRVRVRTDPSPKRKPIRKSKGLRVTFIEDPNEKSGIACTYLESGGPLSPEEKVSAWYGGRNYKLFKSLCYSESVEAKENEDYCGRFDKVWAACATISVDFAWQELMKAEHKKNSPNNAVMLAKARCRGFEREIFPETLLRNRLATVKYVVRSYRQAMLSITIEKQDKETAVREASLRCSQPFRRFARLMAEGDALLVAAWERVKKKDESLDESRRSNAQMERRASRRDLMAAAGRRSSRSLLSSGESLRDLMSSLKSSGSCRKLMSDNDFSNESRRNLLSGSKGSSNSRRNLMSKLESHRDLLVSLKSSGSSRKLMSDYVGRDGRSTDPKRNLLAGSRSESKRNMLSGSRSDSRRSLLTGSSSDSKRSLGTKSRSSRRLQLDKSLEKFSDDEEDIAPPRPSRRSSRKLQSD